MSEQTKTWACNACGRVWKGPGDESFARRNASQKYDHRPVQQVCRSCASEQNRDRAARLSERTDEEIQAVREATGEAWCVHHQRYEPVENFGVARRKPNGCQSYCRQARREIYAAQRTARETK